MQANDTDGESGHRLTHLRTDLFVALAISGLAAVRIFADWQVESWLIWLSVAGLVFFLVLTPRKRPGVRSWLSPRFGYWWVVALCLLTGFSAVDPSGMAVYPAGAALLVASVSTMSSRRAVQIWGVAALAGFAVVTLSHPATSPSLIGLSTGLVLALIWLAGSTAEHRHRQELARRRSEGRTEALLEHASDAVIAISPEREIVYASASVRTVLGYEPNWLTSERLKAMSHPDHLATIQEWLASIFESEPGYSTRLESRTRRGDGTWIDVEVIGANRLQDPMLRAAVLSIRDISLHKSLERDLTRQAFEDPLTRLPNRALFHDRTEHALARNGRDGSRISLLVIDLDDFKRINDSLGHQSGDDLIRTVAQRIRDQVRPADTLARLGGDEFAVLVEDLTPAQVDTLAGRLLAAIREPVRLENRELVCTASIGIATVTAGQGHPDTGILLRDADLAMYAAKAAGRDRHLLFDPGMYVDILREADDRADIERALAADEFTVHYQPIVDLPTSELTGLEALIRWDHPERGLIGPNDFISLAETTGLIVPLGRWVLEQACAQLASWAAQYPQAQHLRMSVNLSPRQFQHAGLVDDVAEVLTCSGVNPSKITLEITESLLMQDVEATVDMLTRLKALGVRLAIDDFGTGYSSLSYIKRFPVDILKIDRSFVEGITGHGENASLAEAVVQLGQALQLQTVAEGIETPEQWSTLRDLGCDFGQGYLFARPAAPDAIPALFSNARPSPAPAAPGPRIGPSSSYARRSA